MSGWSSATHTAAEVIAGLGLEPLDQEGGWFRRVAQGAEASPGRRGAYSVILFMLTPESFSALHRLATDEIWCWQAGDAMESLRLGADGRGEWVRLGPDGAAGARVTDVVAAGVWQGTRLAAGGRWVLGSCIVAPEFRWEDFELGERSTLAAAYPEWAAEIGALTRGEPPVGRR